eukprot:scaffold39853_cov30-Phaeocystis_antarctica.AAC.1
MAGKKTTRAKLWVGPNGGTARPPGSERMGHSSDCGASPIARDSPGVRCQHEEARGGELRHCCGTTAALPRRRELLTKCCGACLASTRWWCALRRCGRACRPEVRT